MNFSLSTSILLNFFFPFMDVRCFFCQVLQYSRTIVLLKKFKPLKKPLFSKATMVMRFPAKKNAGCPKAPRDFPPRKDGILYPPIGLSWDSPPPPTESVRTDGRLRDYYVTTKISWINRLPNLLSNGASLADFARRFRYDILHRLWHCRCPK